MGMEGNKAADPRHVLVGRQRPAHDRKHVRDVVDVLARRRVAAQPSSKPKHVTKPPIFHQCDEKKLRDAE